MSGFKVMAERCAECLYGPDKIVSSARRKKLLAGLNQRDDFFVCHKSTINGVTVACRGDWDQRGCGQMGRIAARLRAVSFTDARGEPADPPHTAAEARV